MKHLAMWFCIAAIALGTSAVAAADTFLLVPGLPGDVTEKAHSGWIRVATVEWDVEAGTSWTKGGGASVGKPSDGRLRLTLPNGPWSPTFVRAITTGKKIDTTPNPIIVEHVPVEGRPAYRLTIQGLFLTKYGLQSGAQNPPLDSVEGVFKTVTIDQFYTGSDGKVRTVNIAWDIPTGAVLPEQKP